jgi:Asp-tRNA(Asn)/Glu-tRNA(Gln) amidotransferase A subunit family amidase
MDARLSDLDGLVLPTTPIVAPTIAEVSSSEIFSAKNLLHRAFATIYGCDEMTAFASGS